MVPGTFLKQADAGAVGLAEDDLKPSTDTSNSTPEESGKDPAPDDDAGENDLLRQDGDAITLGCGQAHSFPSKARHTNPMLSRMTS
jgi:hypothetical protein